ncbi:putative cytochrome P450 [Xylaria castorea]|nr:putative cytochrome P450 [Xylaria castorea]
MDTLAEFPGPKIAAASEFYEFYYDVIKGGQYLYKTEEMHRKSDHPNQPSEIVINDPSFYNEVYVTANTRRTTIWPRHRAGIGVDGYHIMTKDHDLHRRRRNPLEPFFSRLGASSVLIMYSLQFAGDVIGKICCENPPLMMAREEFGKEWHNFIKRIITKTLLFTHIPQLAYLTRLAPTSFLYRFDPSVVGFNEYRKMMTQYIRQSKNESLDQRVDEKPTLSRYIATSDMPTSEQSVDRLSREAMILFGGAAATTPHALALISYHILNNPKIEARLKEDLTPFMLDFPKHLPKWTDLEGLPYLQAVIKDGLRLSYSLMRRLPRAYSLHTNFEVYPNPFKFIPERWLGDYDPGMNESWVPFSRGPRKCLGYNLALAEINWALVVLFRPNGPKLSLYETNESDITPARDFLLPLPRAGSRGCRRVWNESMQWLL